LLLWLSSLLFLEWCFQESLATELPPKFSSEKLYLNPAKIQSCQKIDSTSTEGIQDIKTSNQQFVSKYAYCNVET
jgi:hypothetical protein